MPVLIDLIGQKFGKLTVIKRDHSRKRGYWFCECECGETTSALGGHLRAECIKTCGKCSHNMSHSVEYDTWKHMIQRCTNPKAKRYNRYGGRGIKICSGIRNNFMVFYNIVGSRPNNYSIDRIKNEGNYSCGECDECRQNSWSTNIRWATIHEQNNNHSRNQNITFNNKTQTLKQWSDELNIPYDTLRGRIRRKWSIEKAFTEPIKNRTTKNENKSNQKNTVQRESIQLELI